jgi:hypothetical protein
MQHHAETEYEFDSLQQMLDETMQSLDNLSATFDRFWNDVEEWEICQRLEIVSHDLLRIRNESLQLLQIMGAI